MKKFIICLITTAILLTCVGCSGILNTFENEKLRTDTEAMINSILNEDIEAAYLLVDEVCTREEFKPIFYQLVESLKQADDYSLKIISINTNNTFTADGKIETVSAVYMMVSNQNRYIISVQTTSRYEKLSSFYITEYEKSNYYSTGLLNNMKGANPFQWALLLSNVISIGIMIFALVDCCRHKVKMKPLWIAIILLGIVTVGAIVSANSLKLKINFSWLTAYTAFVRYGGGAFWIRIMIPLGSIIYLIIRKFIIEDTAAAAYEEAADTVLENETFQSDR